MAIIFSEKCLEYDFGKINYVNKEHPEKPSRIGSAYKILLESMYKFSTPKKADERDLLLVHSKKHVENIRKGREGTFYDEDTPFIRGIYGYSSLAAGAAIQASEIALKNGKSFSLMRPPGHHASRETAAGFCYFNNVAVASAKLLKEKKIGKIAILDTDLHHGNGTEAIFLGRKDVLYTSLHLYPAYPWTGKEPLENSINFPLGRGTDENQYLKYLEDALSCISDFKPEMLAVSAGFDTYREDPIEKNAFLLEIESFRKIGQKIRNINLPTFCVMEGGYSGKVGECLYEFLQGFEFG